MTTSLEQSVKEKLRTLAKTKRSTFAELWGNLVLERFLARLYPPPLAPKNTALQGRDVRRPMLPASFAAQCTA